MARDALRLPVLSEGAEHLVMGHLMRRNILTYKAPPGNEGYDLICIHPDPRYSRVHGEKAQVRVQVKSRYQTDCDRSFPIKEKALDAFDFLVVVFLNIGKFYRGHDGTTGAAPPEFYTFPPGFIREHHNVTQAWQRVKLRGLDQEIEPYKGEAGFEQIARALGIPRPVRSSATAPPPPREGAAEQAERLATVLADLAVTKSVELEEMKPRSSTLERDDGLWKLLLQAFATLGSSVGYAGLIDDPENYNRVTFEAIEALEPTQRVPEVKTVMRRAKVRYPDRKAKMLVQNFELVCDMGGPKKARDLLLEQPGREGKMAFLKRFKNIGDKYSRDILMDCYHPEFRDSIALDTRVKSITDALGLEFSSYEAHEQFYLGVAELAGLDGWTVDRLIYNWREEVLSGLLSPWPA